MALAKLYSDLAWFYIDTKQYQKTIIYQKAVDILTGNYQSHTSQFKCQAYYFLRQYPEAIQACTTEFELGGTYPALFWRGLSYKETGQRAEALQDMTLLAGVDNRFRSSAAIQLSVIHGDMQDFQGQLEVLDRYAYLYDEKTQTKNVLAVSYNNRCYALMQLNRLEEALADCNKSLSFENIPDAYQKRQNIMKRLNRS